MMVRRMRVLAVANEMGRGGDICYHFPGTKMRVVGPDAGRQVCHDGWLLVKIGCRSILLCAQWGSSFLSSYHGNAPCIEIRSSLSHGRVTGKN